VSRFIASGDLAVPGSETVILELDPLSAATKPQRRGNPLRPRWETLHRVGENANGANAQTLTNLLGKLLRINPDGSIPSDNSFFASASGVNRAIWALGLRNPFSFAIQRGTGRMFINDVGENTWEEINDGIVGSNYGWPAPEGATADPSFRSQDRADDDGSRRCSVDGNRASAGLAVRPSVQDELVARLQRLRDLLELLVAMGSWPRRDLDDGGGRQGGCAEQRQDQQPSDQAQTHESRTPRLSSGLPIFRKARISGLSRSLSRPVRLLGTGTPSALRFRDARFRDGRRPFMISCSDSPSPGKHPTSRDNIG
jgi:hypothetical protein